MEGFYVQKLNSIKITKSDEKIIYAIGCLTLQERKKATKTTHSQIGLFCGCSEKTVQRAVAKLETAKLITRGRPKWKKSAWFINISADFYQETKAIFHEQKKLSIQAQNVQTGRTISINNSISFYSSSSFQKETKTEIKNSTVEFFISDKIKELDLKDLSQETGLTYSDLESISRKVGWQNPDLQYSINNFSEALKTKTFIPTKLSPREAFIAILTGNNKKVPSLFNKPQELKKIEAGLQSNSSTIKTVDLEETKKDIEKKQVQQNQENYWLSLPDSKRSEYLKDSDDNLEKAILIAATQRISEELKTFRANLNQTTEPTVSNLKSKTKPTFVLKEENFIQTIHSPVSQISPTGISERTPGPRSRSYIERAYSLDLSE